MAKADVFKPSTLFVSGLLIALGGVAGVHATETSEPASLDEVVVTAEKREEKIQDVPMSVTALSGESLLDSNQVRLEQYFTSVPGLALNTDQRGTPSIVIRGLNSGSGNPTVAVTIDDVPYGSSSTYGGGTPIPDIDPSDLARVEVLRGPQGTLYGASSLGGLLKYVTLDPSTDGFSGRAEAGTEDIYNAPDWGYQARAAVNVPITDTLAARASGFVRQDPGYIDNLETDRRGVNRLDSEGGHLSVLWKPTNDFSVKLSGLLQDDKSLGEPIADPTLGDLKQSFLPDTGYETKNEAFSATIKAKVGTFDLTSLTGYNVFSVTDELDWSNRLGKLGPDFFPGSGATSFLDNDSLHTTKISQELRAATSLGKYIDWLGGLFFTHESSHTYENWFAVNPSTLQIPGTFLIGEWPSTYEEYAVFTDLTIHFTDRFDVQLGGREGENRQTYTESDGGALFDLPSGAPAITPEVITKDNAFTYLVTPRYKLSEDLMVYIRVASGYRPGGPTPTCTLIGVPCHFDPDRTTNYEVGVKGDAFDHLLTFDAAAYYVAWRNIQLELATDVGISYANGGNAKSQGVELSWELRPVTGLTVAGWVAINDAQLTQNLPFDSAAPGEKGDPLPLSPRFSGMLSVEDVFPLVGNLNGIVGADVSYVGQRWSDFEGSGSEPRPYLPAYGQTNAHAGVNYGEWTLRLTANNLADKRGVLNTNFDRPYVDYIQPRTISASIVVKF